MIRNKLDPEMKVELLIKLSFGISIEDLAEEYHLTKSKIVNLRKNNYLLYNEFFEHWKIDKEVAIHGFTPKYERAVSIVKKFYKNKINLAKTGQIYYLEKECKLEDVIDLADSILKKDNINNFKVMPHTFKNHY